MFFDCVLKDYHCVLLLYVFYTEGFKEPSGYLLLTYFCVYDNSFEYFNNMRAQLICGIAGGETVAHFLNLYAL